MDKNHILDLLSVPPTSVITLTQLEMVLWGQELHFHAQTRLSDEKITFEIRFLDCREMRWHIYTHMQDANSPAFPASELVNFRIGRNQHRSPAHMLTDHFGLSLFYGKLELVIQDKVLPLE